MGTRLSAGSNDDCRCGTDRQSRSRAAGTAGGTDRRPLPHALESGHHEVPSDGGGQTWATIATLLQTAKMNAIDPFAWLTQTLERIANGWPNSDINALMPWNYQS